MGDTTEPVFEQETLEATAKQVAERAGEELGGVLNTTVSMAFASVASLPAAGVADEDAPIVMVLCRTNGTPEIPVLLVVPRTLGAVLAGLQLGHSIDEILVEGKSSLDSEMLGALRGVLKVVVTCIRDAMDAAMDPGLGGEIQIKDALEVEEPASDPTWLDPGLYWRVRYRVETEGVPKTQLDVLFPAHGESDADAPDAADAADAAEPKRILLVAEDPESLDVDALSEEACASVEAFDLDSLEEQISSGFGEWDAILIPWLLGGNLGIETVERLAPVVEKSQTAIVVVHPKPTRSMVMSALHAGASSFVMEIADVMSLFAAASSSGPAQEQS